MFLNSECISENIIITCDVASIPCYLQVEYRMHITNSPVSLPGKGTTLTNRDRFPRWADLWRGSISFSATPIQPTVTRRD